MDEATVPVMPRTLVEAHAVLARIRPARQAPLTEWLAYYQLRSTALYAEIADIDRDHHHEILHWADHEHERAKEIEAQIHTSGNQ